jgi:hypothetical protein
MRIRLTNVFAFVAIMLLCAGGAYFLKDASVYAFQAADDGVGFARSEYSEGLVLSIILSLPFWFGVAAVVYWLRHKPLSSSPRAHGT